MKLWLLSNNDLLGKDDDPWYPWPYDKYFGFVVRAETEEEARQIAHDAGGGENESDVLSVRDPWKNAKYSTCVELLPEGEAGRVLSDFRQG